MNALAGFLNGLAGGYTARNERDMRKAEHEKIMQGQSQETSAAPPADASYSPPPTPGTMQTGGLKGLIDKYEGGGRYDTLFGHSQRDRFKGVDVSKMTLGDLYEFSSPRGEYGNWVKEKVGRIATPMGRHQIVGTTLRRTARQMGLPDDTVFSGDVQDRMFTHLADARLKSAKSMAGKMEGLRAEWEGFRNVPDSVLRQTIMDYEKQDGMSVRPQGQPV